MSLRDSISRILNLAELSSHGKLRDLITKSLAKDLTPTQAGEVNSLLAEHGYTLDDLDKFTNAIKRRVELTPLAAKHGKLALAIASAKAAVKAHDAESAKIVEQHKATMHDRESNEPGTTGYKVRRAAKPFIAEFAVAENAKLEIEQIEATFHKLFEKEDPAVVQDRDDAQRQRRARQRYLFRVGEQPAELDLPVESFEGCILHGTDNLSVTDDQRANYQAALSEWEKLPDLKRSATKPPEPPQPAVELVRHPSQSDEEWSFLMKHVTNRNARYLRRLADRGKYPPLCMACEMIVYLEQAAQSRHRFDFIPSPGQTQRELDKLLKDLEALRAQSRGEQRSQLARFGG